MTYGKLRPLVSPDFLDITTLAVFYSVFLSLVTQTPMSLGSLAGPLATGEAAATSDAEPWISRGSSQTEGQQLQHWPLS